MKVNETSHLIKPKKNLLFLLLLLSFCVASCTRSDNQPSYSVGSFLFKFTPQKVSNFVIIRNDIDTESNWVAEFNKNANSLWQVSSAPFGKQLVDQNANDSFINHFFDTLTTLKAVEKAPNGLLSSFGLSPPQFAIKWQTQEKQHELHLGFGSSDSHASAYAKIANDPSSQVFIVKGASLAMLKRINQFEDLRKIRLETIDEDQVYKVEVYKKEELIFTAKRVSGQWANAKNITYKDEHSKNITHWLKKLTHLRVSQFIDSKGRSKNLFSTVNNQAAYKITFTNRKGELIAKLSLAYLNNQLIGISSKRHQAAFVLDLNAIIYFQPPNS